MGVPAAVVPVVATDVVSGVEDLAEVDVAELGNGEEGGGFHFDYEGAFGFAEVDFFFGFTEECVCGPCFADLVFDVALGEGVGDFLNHDGIGFNFT